VHLPPQAELDTLKTVLQQWTGITQAGLMTLQQLEASVSLALDGSRYVPMHIGAHTAGSRAHRSVDSHAPNALLSKQEAIPYVGHFATQFWTVQRGRYIRT